MSAVVWPAPTGAPRVCRNRPYALWVDEAFDCALHNIEYRCFIRWLYRALRRQRHSTTFSARAQIANATMQLDGAS